MELKQVYELDVCDEQYESLEDAVNRLIQGTEIACTVIDTHGPGGWPLVRFVCESDEDVRTLRRRYDPYNDSGLFDEIG